ncbi:MAG: hypothetical protein JWM11_2305 [Planctomycetaceae bacterium]|nr:hypothetical protein [Planctomycetaceae bacterium]
MLFPCGLPFPTAFYLILYVLTFALHQAFMHYVLAGSLYVAWTMAFPGTSKNQGELARSEQPLAAVLRDWMPFLLSAAITAGVAPLLFIQIVYQRQFYSANLLLFWRWMTVVPVLIVAFYLLYLVKSSIMNSWPRALRAAVAVATAGCFVFVGFCWTVNYLIGISESKWPEIYQTGQMPFFASTVLSRMAVWIGGSFATMTAIVAWQLFQQQKRNIDRNLSVEIQTLSSLTFGGLAVLFAAGLMAIFESTASTRQAVLGLGAFPYLFLSLAGIAAQVGGWVAQRRLSRLRGQWLTVISSGALLTLLGISFTREAVRSNLVDLTSQYEKHAEAAKVGGFAVFLIFTVLVTGVIGWCLWIVRQGLLRTESAAREGDASTPKYD